MVIDSRAKGLSLAGLCWFNTPDTMKNELTETAAVAMLPWVASIADLNPWITFLVGVASLIVLITKIIDWFEARGRRKRDKR